MTSIDRDSFSLSALGTQAQSNRATICTHKISNVGREQFKNVYISEEHTRIARVGRESPAGGPIYNVTKSTLGGVSYGFGTAKRDITTLKRTSATKNKPGEFFAPNNEDPDDFPTNAALDVVPDEQQFKYPRLPTMRIGTEPRGKLKDAFLLQNHSVAFYSRSSPGPAAIGDEFGPKFQPTKPRMAPARPFGAKTMHKGVDWMSAGRGDNPEEVGPGRHERKDVSFGPQYLTRRRNQSVHAFPQAPKFAKDRKDDSISKLEAAQSSLGKQPLAKNRSAPCINFSADSRATRDKTKLCLTKSDEGPRASMPKFVAYQPPLPCERTIMTSGFG
mmetsp:Transcript_10054/g.29859  ORF Transcript_10054/g.29859 Transcript_10054/m.29859 type:complete len:331 (-) Transcript_10054:55-1047(-)